MIFTKNRIFSPKQLIKNTCWRFTISFRGRRNLMEKRWSDLDESNSRWLLPLLTIVALLLLTKGLLLLVVVVVVTVACKAEVVVDPPVGLKAVVSLGTSDSSTSMSSSAMSRSRVSMLSSCPPPRPGGRGGGGEPSPPSTPSRSPLVDKQIDVPWTLQPE